MIGASSGSANYTRNCLLLPAASRIVGFHPR